MTTNAVALALSGRAMPPALTTFVAYLRPAPRDLLLAEFAELGIFVMEHQGIAGALEAALDARPDIACVVAASEPAHEALAMSLARFPAFVPLTIVPGPADAQRYEARGFGAILTDADLRMGAQTRLAEVARSARRLRDAAHEAGDVSLFGSLRLRDDAGSLANDDRSLPLSAAERDLLQRLALSAGRAVATAELERRFARLGFAGMRPAAVVQRVRNKAESLGGDPARLGTVRGFGYVLMA